VVVGRDYFDAPIVWDMPPNDFCRHAS